MSDTTEIPVVIQGDLQTPMLAMLHRPANGVAASGTGVLIVNGGAQYRAGAHRLFVQLARHLSAQGLAVLRFDFPGQGDSPGEAARFEDSSPCIEAAIDTFCERLPELHGIALAGLCDGASASLIYVHAKQDRRVTQLVLINPWVQSEKAEAQAQLRHYYHRRLLMPDFWVKLARGRMSTGAIRELAQRTWHALLAKPAARPDATNQMARAWSEFPHPILLVLSENDRTAQTFRRELSSSPDWRHRPPDQVVQLVSLPGADHTLSNTAAQETLQRLCTAFMSTHQSHRLLVRLA